MIVTSAMRNGLRRTTETDAAMLNECMATSVSLTRLWDDANDSAKVVIWDEAWENYLEHRANLIDEEGREKYLPWNAYKFLDLNWLDGYAYSQVRGDCCSFGARNSLKASNLTNAIRTGRKPKEIAQSISYGIARGNGQMAFGDGLNLNPMAKYSAENGNYWTEDFGKYDGGAYCRKYQRDSDQDRHAKQTQSIIVFLPEPTFHYCYLATRAGFGINIGVGTFPGGSKLNRDDLAQVSNWDSGGHSVALIGAWRGKSGTPYIYLENSHPTHYSTDSLNDGHQWGCWVDEKDMDCMARSGGFGFGNWYVNIGELPKERKG